MLLLGPSSRPFGATKSAHNNHHTLTGGYLSAVIALNNIARVDMLTCVLEQVSATLIPEHKHKAYTHMKSAPTSPFK